jgi:hypothetical protein
MAVEKDNLFGRWKSIGKRREVEIIGKDSSEER